MKDRYIAAIDVGSSKITTLIANVSQEGRVNIIGASSVASRGLRKGQVVDIEEAVTGISESLSAAERMAGYSVERAFISVSGTQIQSQNSKGVVAVADPESEITDTDVKRVLEAARAVSMPSSREIIHVLPRQFTVDGQEGIKDPVGMTGIRLEVETHIISGSTGALKNLVKVVSDVGVDVEGLVFSGLASAEAVLSDTEKELGVILVDIGGGATELNMYVEGALAYSSVLPIGARNVTNDMAIGLRVGLDSAEQIKLALSRQPKQATTFNDDEEPQTKESIAERRRKEDEIDLASLGVHIEGLQKISRKTLVDGIIKLRLNEIFRVILAEVKKSGLGGLTPSGIVLTGGGAQTIGIVEACRQVLAMPVRIGNPQGVSGLIDEIMHPAFATAIGLILYGVRQEEMNQSRGNMPSISLKGIPFSPAGILKKLVDFFKALLP